MGLSEASVFVAVNLKVSTLWWDLCEVSLFVTEFHAPHVLSADTETAWRGLEEHLDPSRWIERT